MHIVSLALALIFTTYAQEQQIIQEVQQQVQIQQLSDKEIKKEIRRLEKVYKFPNKLFQALIKFESNYNQNATSPQTSPGVTSYGLGQITKATADNFCKFNSDEIYDAIKNLRCSARIFAYHLKRFDGNIEYALSAYNAGEPCVCNGGIFIRFEKPCKKDKQIMKCEKEGDIHNTWYTSGVIKVWHKLTKK